MEKLNLTQSTSAELINQVGQSESLDGVGVYTAKCYDADGNLKWEDTYTNLITTVGKNDLLDKYLAGSGYTGTFYLGLISSSSYSAISAADTAASHAGWLEAGGMNAPIYSQSARPTAAWSAASAGSKALSAALTFSIITTGGTIKGSFLSTVATKDSATGILFSAGLFAGGDKVVTPSDTLTVSYSLGV